MQGEASAWPLTAERRADFHVEDSRSHRMSNLMTPGLLAGEDELILLGRAELARALLPTLRWLLVSPKARVGAIAKP